MAGPRTENLNPLLKDIDYGTKTSGNLDTLLQMFIDSVPRLKEEEKELEAKVSSIEEEMNSAFLRPPPDKQVDEQTSTQDQIHLELKTYISCTSHEVQYIMQQREAMIIEMNKLKFKRHTKLEELDSLQRVMRQKSENMRSMERASREEISICKELERQSSESVSKIKELLNQTISLSVYIKRNNILYHMENKRKKEEEEKGRMLLETKEDIQCLKNVIEGTWKDLELLIGEVEDFEISMCQQVQEWRLNLDKLWKEKNEAIDVFFESNDKLMEQMMKWKDGSEELEENMIGAAVELTSSDCCTPPGDIQVVTTLHSHPRQ